jgi:hypothetical protein
MQPRPALHDLAARGQAKGAHKVTTLPDLTLHAMPDLPMYTPEEQAARRAEWEQEKKQHARAARKPRTRSRKKRAVATKDEQSGPRQYARRTPKQRSTSSRRAQAAVQPRDSRGRFSFGAVKDFVTGKTLRDRLRRNAHLAKKSARDNSPVLGTLDHPAKAGRRPAGTRRRRKVVRPGERQQHAVAQGHGWIDPREQRRAQSTAGYRMGVAKHLAGRVGDGFKALFAPGSSQLDEERAPSKKEEE